MKTTKITTYPIDEELGWNAGIILIMLTMLLVATVFATYTLGYMHGQIDAANESEVTK